MSEQEHERTEGESAANTNQDGAGFEADAQEHEASEVLSIEKSKLDAMEASLKAAEEEKTENYNKYLRALADLENVRRRSEREKSDLQKFVLESFLKDVLPVLDSFDKALAGGGQDEQEQKESFVAGIKLVNKQLVEVLEKQGLSAVAAEGAKFDPNLHQAIQKVECKDTDEELVKEEYSRGYTLHGRLLRPAMVSVKVPAE